jgi:membrane fusion protein (multidrug efflux system)
VTQHAEIIPEYFSPRFFISRILPCILLTVTLTACEKSAQLTAPPPEVVVATPVQRDVPVSIELVGQAQGSQDVEIRARVEGYLDSVNFKEGSVVKQGEVLYRIDPKPFQATVSQAKAELATANVRLDKTRNDVKRFTPLVKKQAISQQEMDNAQSAFDAAREQVEAAKAAVDTAQINLGYTTITAPTDGIVGFTRVKAGNLVGRGESTLLTTVSKVDPILFRVGISEAEYLTIAKGIDKSKSEAERRKALNIRLMLADNSEYEFPGEVDAVESNIDAATGTLAVQFRFPNPDRLLRPGQYGRVNVVMSTLKNAVLVPQSAVLEMQGIYQIAVVDAENKATIRAVKVGPRYEKFWTISEGLQPGEKIVVEGLQRVRNGMPVSVKGNAVKENAPKTDKAG